MMIKLLSQHVKRRGAAATALPSQLVMVQQRSKHHTQTHFYSVPPLSTDELVV